MYENEEKFVIESPEELTWFALMRPDVLRRYDEGNDLFKVNKFPVLLRLTRVTVGWTSIFGWVEQGRREGGRVWTNEDAFCGK